MDFGDGPFEILIENSGEIVCTRREYVDQAIQYVWFTGEVLVTGIGIYDNDTARLVVIIIDSRAAFFYGVQNMNIITFCRNLLHKA